MRGYREAEEKEFFSLFRPYYDLEKDSSQQHDRGNYSLARMLPLAALAGNPENSLKIIHVAGTKGKGSTSHYISSLLSACQQKVGLFTSPHLATVRERFQINNQLISYEQLIDSGRQFAARLADAGLTPSLFEIFTVMALKIFADSGLDWAVVETGIGGRLDASNYITSPRCTVITPVSYDHVALLGSSIEEIAGEKAGILKPNCPLVLAKQPFAAAEETILRQAAALSVPVHRPCQQIPDGLLPASCAMFLRDNFALALRSLEVLGLQADWSKFQLPELRARCETISQHPLVVLDAAHNADSMEKLVSSLQKLYPGLRFTVVLGVVQGKDLDGIVAALQKLDAEFILTNPHTEKKSALPELQQKVSEAGLKVSKVIDNLREKQQLPENTPLLFTGSFFTANIGEDLFAEKL